MASLYDLELHESNNFIHSLMSGGQPYSLKFMEDQLKSFEAMGETGKALVAQFQDPNSDMGKNYQRLKSLEVDLKAVMKAHDMTADLAKQVQDILTKNPESLSALPDNERELVSSYWLKKKSIAATLMAKGYSPEELYS